MILYYSSLLFFPSSLFPSLQHSTHPPPFITHARTIRLFYAIAQLFKLHWCLYSSVKLLYVCIRVGWTASESVCHIDETGLEMSQLPSRLLVIALEHFLIQVDILF